MVYLFGPALGLVLGVVSALFAQGGIKRRRVLRRVLGYRGRWRRQRRAIVAVSAAVGLYAAWLFGAVGHGLIGFQLTACYLLCVTVTDLRGRRIPDDASLVFAGVFVLFQASYLLTGGPTQAVAQLMTAALGAAAGGLLLVCHLARRDAVGLGDVKMLAVTGLAAGFPGVLYVLIRAMVAIFVYSVIQLIRGKLARKAQVPLAPFLLFGVLI